ncbi:MAG: glycosyltransferase family 2 protein [Solirubrobacteraceae bacterium]
MTVAIPVNDGGARLGETLEAVRSQRLPDAVAELELLVCDSGSSDGSVALARRYGATVIEIAPQEFGHGRTRNLLASEAAGEHVAFLTQDSMPAADDWLARLLGGFTLAPDVAMVFGPYLPRPDASVSVARELTAWFEGFSPDGGPRVDRLTDPERAIASRALLGPRGFFTDANGVIAKGAWEQVPFRPVSYAEDHALAHDMLRAGYAKVYEPRAAVIHSHDYSLAGWFRRSYEEARALRELYGHVEPLGFKQTPLKLWGLVGADWRWARTHAAERRSRLLLPRAAAHHAARISGAVIGSRQAPR